VQPSTPPVQRHREQAGVAHFVLLVLMVVLGVLVASAWLGSQPDQVSSSATPDIDAAAIAKAVNPSVVNLTATLDGGRGSVAGTGVVLSATGSVLTNNHVIAGAGDISAQVAGTGPQFSAVVVGYDVADDVAVLQLDRSSGFAAAVIGDPARAHVGDSVVAIGNAGGRGGMPATAAGTIKAFGQRVTATDSAGSERETLSDMIQITAAIEPGDSGGPVVDATRHVIGLTAAASTGGLFPASAVNGFAIPIDRAVAIARQIDAGRSSATVHVGPRAILGVQIKSVQSSPAVAAVDGAVVGLVQNSSPARVAGLRAGDVIVSIDGADISSLSDLNAALDRRRPGDVITLGWTDTTGHSRTASVELVIGPPL
jgi:S1-C subfamily serine protease